MALTARDVERAFHEHGVNCFFATSTMKELAEGVRRLVRAGHRDELVIVSMALLPTGWSLKRCWARQARALGVEQLDVYLLGWVQGRWYFTGRTWESMQRLRDEGKVGAHGFSIHQLGPSAELTREFRPDVLMIRYNASHRKAEELLFESLGEERPGVIAYTATRWGMLLDPLPAAGFERGLSAPDCYRFALAHPAVDTVLCAARSEQEMAENVAGVLEGPLEGEPLIEARRFGDAVQEHARGGKRWMFR